MPETSEGDSQGEGSFTQYRSEDYSIIDHLDKSSESSVIHLPKLTSQPVYRHLSSQLPPTTLRHKYIAFQNLNIDKHLSKLLELIPSLLSTHSQRSSPKSSRMTSKIRPFQGLRNNKENPKSSYSQ